MLRLVYCRLQKWRKQFRMSRIRRLRRLVEAAGFSQTKPLSFWEAKRRESLGTLIFADIKPLLSARQSGEYIAIDLMNGSFQTGPNVHDLVITVEKLTSHQHPWLVMQIK